MFGASHAFSGFSVDDLDAAKTFYAAVLGLDVGDNVNEMGTLDLRLGGGGHVIVYAKDNHVPATFTILNFEVDDIDAAVDQLAAAGVSLERYDGMNQDDRGIARGKAVNMGPDIAWFTDPAGNILSVLAN
ncbi:MAG: VOC family protein [Rhodoglobus sp.]